MPKKSSELSTGGYGELKRRLLFLLFGLLIFRLGSYIPVPGIDPRAMTDLFKQHSTGVLGVFNMFTGGALRRMSLFALGIMPYITASIVMQMMTMILPSMQQLRKEGEPGRRKINQYTRYGTLFLAVVQSIGISKWLASSHVTLDTSLSFYMIAVLTLVSGTMFLMWLGEQMTERGIGNGISMIIYAGIVARIPSAISSVSEQVRQGQLSGLHILMVMVLIVFVLLVVVAFERAQRQIRINYAKRQEGNKVYAAQASHLPMKINMAGVIPPIFAQSIIAFLGTAAEFFSGHGASWLSTAAYLLKPGQPLYMVIFAVAVIFFAFFYTQLMYNPKETADNLKKSGAFIQGKRPGAQTSEFLSQVTTRLTLVGSIYLALVALLPQFLIVAWHVPFYFGGTSLLIIVVVTMDFMAQVQAHLMSQQYQSLMRRGRRGGRGGGMSLID